MTAGRRPPSTQSDLRKYPATRQTLVKEGFWKEPVSELLGTVSVLLIRKLVERRWGSAQAPTVSDRARTDTCSPQCLVSAGLSTASGLMEEAQACPPGAPALSLMGSPGRPAILHTGTRHPLRFRDTHTHAHQTTPTTYRTTTSACDWERAGVFSGLQGPAQLPLLSETLAKSPGQGGALPPLVSLQAPPSQPFTGCTPACVGLRISLSLRACDSDSDPFYLHLDSLRLAQCP